MLYENSNNLDYLVQIWIKLYGCTCLTTYTLIFFSIQLIDCYHDKKFITHKMINLFNLLFNIIKLE